MMGLIRCIALAAIFQSAPAQAGIAEYFNGYGTESRGLSEVGEEGGGWLGPWRSRGPIFFPGKNLEYHHGSYSNTGNGTDPEDGLAVYGGGDASSICFRDFAEPLDGTIWISAVVAARAEVSDAILWLRGDAEAKETSARTFLALRTPSSEVESVAVVRYDGLDLTGDKQRFGPGQPHLLLGRIVMNEDGSRDSIALWMDPVASAGPEDLGAPDVTIADADALGDQLTGIGISFGYAGSMDAIRIGNGPDAFRYVIAGGAP